MKTQHAGDNRPNPANKEPFGFTPYLAPPSDNKSALAALLDAVGKLHGTGGTEGRPRFNTDGENLFCLQAHTETARTVALDGLAAIGDLLVNAAQNPSLPIPAHTLQAIGWLVKNLGDSVQALEELRQTLERGRPLLEPQGGEEAP